MDERSYPCRKRREGVQSTGQPHPSDASWILHILFSGCKTLHIHVSVSLSKSSTETQHCPLPPFGAMAHVYGGFYCLLLHSVLLLAHRPVLSRHRDLGEAEPG